MGCGCVCTSSWGFPGGLRGSIVGVCDTDVVCLGLVVWADASIVFVLYRYKQ